jgi:hypothetical protein
MSLRSAQSHAAIPIAVAALGALVVASGWLVLHGLPFLVGCVLEVALAAAAIALLVPRRTY